MKQKILRLIEQDIAAAGNDVLRARTYFGGMTLAQMEEEHGSSGQTRKDVLAQYEEQLQEAKNVKTWFEAHVKD